MTSTENNRTPTWWDEVWAWIKHHWWVAILVVAGVWMWFFLKGKSDQVEATLKLYEEQSKDHKRQLDEIRRLREQERVRQQEIEQTYQDTLTTLRREYQEQAKLLNAQKKEELRKIIEETQGGDPDLLAQRINNLFGIPIVRVEDVQ